MTSSTLISPSGQGLNSPQKTVDYLVARDPPGARVASKGRVIGGTPASGISPPDWLSDERASL